MFRTKRAQMPCLTNVSNETRSLTIFDECFERNALNSHFWRMFRTRPAQEPFLTNVSNETRSRAIFDECFERDALRGAMQSVSLDTFVKNGQIKGSSSHPLPPPE